MDMLFRSRAMVTWTSSSQAGKELGLFSATLSNIERQQSNMNSIAPPHRTVVHFCVLFVASTISSAMLAVAQETAEVSLKSLQPADGVEVSLWASEPMVNNPTALDIDSRGRVWIAEGLNYRMKMKEFEDLRRVENADRIKILEDTDDDGKADKVTVFADNIFPVPLGLALEELWQNGKQVGTRVYVGNSPDLLILEDTDGDDIADRRYALLTGFRGVDSDHGLHGMCFGPDGKLYFTVGDTRYGADNVQAREMTLDVTDQSGRRLQANNFGTTLRVNRDGSQLEVLTSGHRNNYEAAVDSFGNVFGSDNDDDGNRGCRMYWVMDGGHYGYQHPKSSRHWAEEIPGIIPKLVGTGNGAPGGLLVYEGGRLPERYEGAILQIDSGTHQVNVHPLVRHGGGFRSDYQVLLKGSDTWFRPIDLSVAPDGSLYVCDWYDAGVGGNRFSDQTTGRIYRLSGTNAAAKPVSFDASDPIAGLSSPNVATRLAARDILVARGAESRSQLLDLYHSARVVDRARALHVLASLPTTGVGDTVAALSDADARIRETALQLLAADSTSEFVIYPDQASDNAAPALRVLQAILPRANDKDAGVRRALLMALRHVPTDRIALPLRELVSRWDGRDRFYLEAIRAAVVDRDAAFVQQLFDELADQALATSWDNQPVALPPYYPIGTNDAFLRPTDQLDSANAASRILGIAWALGRVEALPAIRRLLAANRSPAVEQNAIIALSTIADIAAGKLLVERFLDDSVTDETRRRVLDHLADAVTGKWEALKDDAAFNQVVRAALADQELTENAIELIASCQLSNFSEAVLTIARDESGSPQTRGVAITALGAMQSLGVRELAAELIQQAKETGSGGSLALAALDATYATSGTSKLAELIVEPAMPLDVRRRALQLITTTKPGAEIVMGLHKQDALPQDLTSEFAFLLHNHSDRRVRELAQTEFPQDSGGAMTIHNAASVLSVQGDASRGKDLFVNNTNAACARCHRTSGEGNLVGPDLASIGMKYGAKELLYHIQYPSSAINYNFAAYAFLMDDGRVITGLVNDRQDGKITLGLATGQQVTIDADAVEEEQMQAASLMPEGLISQLSTQEVSDLIEYLLSLRQGDVSSLSQ